MTELILAQEKDLETCIRLIDEGRAFQRAQGFVQWPDYYPNKDTIREDIRLERGYLVTVDEKPAGYQSIDFGGEPAYEVLEGTWRTDGPYAVVHRMAIGDGYRGMGLTKQIFVKIREICLARDVHCIKIDTDYPNLRMQHVLEKEGFVACGTVYFRGEGRIAYDLLF